MPPAATIDLAEIILKDCARIQSQDAERKTRKAAQRDLPPVEPLYEPEDVEPFRSLVREVQFQKPVQVADGITARWVEAGHMLGSGCIELTVEEDGRKKVVVFSGDLGPDDAAADSPVRDFSRPTRSSSNRPTATACIAPMPRPWPSSSGSSSRSPRASGKILVPTFAIGRSQQMLYHLAIMFLRKDIPPFPVFLDSPMALEATKIYRKYPDLFDDELVAWQKKGLLPLNRSIFKPSVTANDSKKINDVEGPCVVLAGAGMCNAGRILHHLKHNLDNPTTQVLIVGFQGVWLAGPPAGGRRKGRLDLRRADSRASHASTRSTASAATPTRANC